VPGEVMSETMKLTIDPPSSIKACLPTVKPPGEPPKSTVNDVF